MGWRPGWDHGELVLDDGTDGTGISVECRVSSVECGLWSLAIHLAPSFQTTTTIAPGLLAFAINESVSFVLGFSPPVTWLESLFQVSTVNTSI